MPLEKLFRLFEPLSFIFEMETGLLQWENDAIMISQGQRVEEGEQRCHLLSVHTDSSSPAPTACKPLSERFVSTERRQAGMLSPFPEGGPRLCEVRHLARVLTEEGGSGLEPRPQVEVAH